MPRIQFTITDEERAFFVEYARRKGLTLSQFAKMAVYSYEATHHFKDMDMGNWTKNGEARISGAAFGE